MSILVGSESSPPPPPSGGGDRPGGAGSQPPANQGSMSHRGMAICLVVLGFLAILFGSLCLSFSSNSNSNDTASSTNGAFGCVCSAAGAIAGGIGSGLVIFGLSNLLPRIRSALGRTQNANVVQDDNTAQESCVQRMRSFIQNNRNLLINILLVVFGFIYALSGGVCSILTMPRSGNSTNTNSSICNCSESAIPACRVASVLDEGVGLCSLVLGTIMLINLLQTARRLSGRTEHIVAQVIQMSDVVAVAEVAVEVGGGNNDEELPENNPLLGGSPEGNISEDGKSSPAPEGE